MELEKLEGKIIGVISKDYNENNFSNLQVKEIILKRSEDALKMVGLSSDILAKKYDELSSVEKSKVRIASKLQEKNIVLYNITKGLVKKDIDYLKRLFKKISSYNRKIILVDKNSYLFLDLIDTFYVIQNNDIVYKSNDIFDLELSKYMSMPQLVRFINDCANKKININHYQDFDELLKAIYRIKS